MRSYRVYVPSELSLGNVVDLDERSSHHLARVLRVRPGDAVTLFNGDGTNYTGEVAAVTKSQVSVTIHRAEAANSESPLRTHLALAVSKGDRFDWAIKKATELGVTTIIPILSQLIDVRLSSERWQKKREHWQHIVISACEQSGRAVVPEVCAPQVLSRWVLEADADYKCVLHPGVGSQALPDRATSAALLIGPEGGFTDDEVGLARDAGFRGLELGPRILRTETAPIVALTVLGSQWGDINA